VRSPQSHASLLGPLRHALQILAQDRVPFGMRNDGCQPAVRKFEQSFGRVLRHAVITELHQQISSVVDDISFGVNQRILNILVGQVEVAAQTDFEGIANQRLQLRDLALQELTIVRPAIIGMRSAHHMRDAIAPGNLAHGDRDIPGPGTVVNERQDVRMNVDHNAGNPLPARCFLFSI
jgi:hypothetical protein